MPRVIALAMVCWLAALAWAGVAHAAPPPTLVLVDPPPVLLDAITTSLAPWHVHIVVVPATDAPAADLAAAHDAGFVVATRRRSLELYDRDGDTAQIRMLPTVVDEPAAAGLALAIKTWMRLGPPPSTAPPTEPAEQVDPDPVPPPPSVLPPPTPPAARPPWRLGALGALGVRMNQGAMVTGPRASIAVLGGYRWGDAIAALDVGTTTDTDASAASSWGQLELSLRAGPRLEVGPGFVRPSLGVALVRGTVVGIQPMSGRTVEDRSWYPGMVGAVEVGWTHGRWDLLGGVGATWTLTSNKVGPLRVSVDAHIEPWVAIGGGLRWP